MRPCFCFVFVFRCLISFYKHLIQKNSPQDAVWTDILITLSQVASFTPGPVLIYGHMSCNKKKLIIMPLSFWSKTSQLNSCFVSKSGQFRKSCFKRFKMVTINMILHQIHLGLLARNLFQNLNIFVLNITVANNFWQDNCVRKKRFNTC